MIDLNYGENYREEIALKHEAEKRIAANLEQPQSNVLLNYGSNSSLLMIFSAYSVKCLSEKRRKLRMLLDYPNYFYTIKQIDEWNIDAIKVRRDEDFELHFPDFMKAMKTYSPDVVLVTTPNNPSGKPFSDEEIYSIIDALPQDSIALIDRSCLNVLPEVNTKTILHECKDKKIIVLHSFSKSHSLSDERLGYLATNSKEIADFLHYKRDLNHNINAVRKCLLAIENPGIVEQKKTILRACHAILESYFASETKGKYYKSFSNFALIKLPDKLTSETVEKVMTDKGILIMGGHRIALGNRYIRLHMSSETHITKFLEEFERLNKQK